MDRSWAEFVIVCLEIVLWNCDTWPWLGVRRKAWNLTPIRFKANENLNLSQHLKLIHGIVACIAKKKNRCWSQKLKNQKSDLKHKKRKSTKNKCWQMLNLTFAFELKKCDLPLYRLWSDVPRWNLYFVNSFKIFVFLFYHGSIDLTKKIQVGICFSGKKNDF